MAKSDETVSAFGKDKLFGKRVDESFRVGTTEISGEPFLMLGALIEPERIKTDIGDARLTKMLVQKLNESTGEPVGQPFEVGTLGSAIADKVEAMQPGELPAIVEVRKIVSKTWKTEALVLQFVSAVGEGVEDVYARYGLDRVSVDEAADQLRPESERIPWTRANAGAPAEGEVPA